MSWQAVARKDFRDAIRSRVFWVISAIFVLLALVMAVAYSYLPDVLAGGDPSPQGLAFFLASVISFFVPITAILLCYKSVAGERESGSIKLMLSLPHSRREVVMGKVVGRAAVLAVATVGALLLGTILGSVLIGTFDVVVSILLLVVALGFTLTYVSAMVGFSSMTGSTTRAAALTVGVFFLFEFLWEVVVLAVLFVGSGFSTSGFMDPPAWIYPVYQITPSYAFLSTLNAAVPGASISLGNAPAADTLDAFYATPWLGALSLAIWFVVPLVIGLRRFDRTDL